jgi:hypothetical protein
MQQLSVGSQITFLSANLMKDEQELYTENHKILLRKTKEDLNEERDILCLRIRRLNISVTFSHTNL